MLPPRSNALLVLVALAAGCSAPQSDSAADRPLPQAAASVRTAPVVAPAAATMPASTTMSSNMAASTPAMGFEILAVDAPPPAPRADVQAGEKPGPNHVWVDGHYDCDGATYTWVAGCWQVPPRPDVQFVPGAYRHMSEGQFWITSHWR